MLHLLSIDLEDWFHLLEVNHSDDLNQWSKFPSRLEIMTEKLLQFFDSHNVKATFFVLGWVAEKYPGIVQEINRLGHEIGCHSYSHSLVHKMSQDEFKRDLEKGIKIIENTANVSVRSYRAPGFSINNNCLWALDAIASFGIKYDSSIFPSHHAHGGIPGAPRTPFIIKTNSNDLKEFPISTVKIIGKTIAYSGGGYFRFFPLILHKQLWKIEEKNKNPVITYLHPKDFDQNQPKIPLPLVRRFKNYINIKYTFGKLSALINSYKCGTLTQVAENSIDWSSQRKISISELNYVIQ